MAAPTTLVSASGDALVGQIISVPAKACGLASEQAGQVLRYNPRTNLYEVQIGDICKEVSLPMPVKGLNGEVVVCLDSDDSDDDFDELGDFEDVGTSKHQIVPLTTFQKGQTVLVPAKAFGPGWEKDHGGETYLGTLKGIVRIELDCAIIWDVHYGKDGDCETHEAFFKAESAAMVVEPRVAWPMKPSMEVLRDLGPSAASKYVAAMLAVCPACFEVLCTGRRRWTRCLDFGESWTNDYLTCVADTEDLQEALQEIGRWGAIQRGLLTSPEARGTALELLLAVWKRLQTDGPHATSAALLLAGLWAWQNEIDLRTANVSQEPYNVQILANMILYGLFEQNSDYSIAYGPKMRAYVAKRPNVPLGGADLLLLCGDAAFVTAQEGKMCNGPQCKHGVKRQQTRLDQLRDALTQDTYGTASVKKALGAFRAFPVLESVHDIKDANWDFSKKLGDRIGAVIDDPTEEGMYLRLQHPLDATLWCIAGSNFTST